MISDGRPDRDVLVLLDRPEDPGGTLHSGLREVPGVLDVEVKRRSRMRNRIDTLDCFIECVLLADILNYNIFEFVSSFDEVRQIFALVLASNGTANSVALLE